MRLLIKNGLLSRGRARKDRRQRRVRRAADGSFRPAADAGRSSSAGRAPPPIPAAVSGGDPRLISVPTDAPRTCTHSFALARRCRPATVARETIGFLRVVQQRDRPQTPRVAHHRPRQPQPLHPSRHAIYNCTARASNDVLHCFVHIDRVVDLCA